MAAVTCQALPPLPSGIVSTNEIKPGHVSQSHTVSNVMLSWVPSTHYYYAIEATTNFHDWYFVTNVPISATNVMLSVRKPMEFYRLSVPYEK